MKILEILFTLTSGGAERFAVDLSNELSKTNDVVLITLKNDAVDIETRNFYKFDLDKRVKYKNLGLPDGAHFSTEWKIYQAIKQEKPDSVHLHGGRMNVFCFMAITLLHRKIKFFQTIHNDLHNGYDKGLNKFVYTTFGRVKKFHCAALSPKNHEDLRALYPNLDVKCITNGRAKMELTDLYADVKNEMESFRTNKDTKLFVHVARCAKDKNQNLLIDGFNELKKQGRNVSLVIIGMGYDSAEGKKLQAKADNHIHFIGPHKNIADYLACADAFTLSSTFEGMPITLLEACLMGLPLISTPVCGAVDIIQNGKNGILSDDFTLNAYIKALNYAIDNHKNLKEQAVIMAKKSPYTIEICAKKYVDFFKS